MEEVTVVSNPGEHIIGRRKHDVCLVLKMRKGDAYLDSDGKSYTEQREFYATSGEVWRKVGQFKRFFDNNEGKGFTFHVKALIEEDAAFDSYFEISRLT